MEPCIDLNASSSGLPIRTSHHQQQQQPLDLSSSPASSSPHSSGCGGGSSAGGTTTGSERSPSELIRLWRSRLSTSDTKATDSQTSRHHYHHHHHHHHHHPPPQPPPTLEGVLSQQPKMSEAQEVSSAVERRESNATEITRQKSEIDEEREEDEQLDGSETPKSESATTPRCDEPTEKKLFGGGGAVPDVHQRSAGQQQQQQPQQQPQKPVAAAPAPRQQVGECNLLPVLVERLRSALELSCSSSSCDDQLPLEDSGVDSEEDFRLWNTTAGLAAGPIDTAVQAATTATTTANGKPKLDLKFLEDILLADIHTALARLQDTLKRVDIGTLTRYNASLDPSNKLYLLRLISNLLAKLKVPEEAIVQSNEPESGASHQGRFHNRRRKNERHTIGVSAEEIARAKRWFDEKSVSSNDSSSPSRVDSIVDKDCIVGSCSERIVEGAPSTAASVTPAETPTIEDKVAHRHQHHQETPMKANTFSDKCMKDAINQQQCKSNREQENIGRYDPLERVLTAPRRFDGLCKDDSSVADGFQERNAAPFYQQQQPNHSGPRHNKFTAKKSKIKRANTIDIPNYLKLKSESPDQIQNGCFALRRPIDVGDRLTNGHHHQRVVPSFEPKTENDRKFLALINRNNNNSNSTETAANKTANGPFKSFNYRQATTVADKNWSNRFWNIKTNFDKPRSESEEEVPRKPGKLDVRKKFENRDDSLERDAVVVGSLRVMPQKQVNGFTHAPTSPFQKIEKPVASKQPETGPPFLKAAGYMPKNNNSMLQAKLKMFDQEPAKSNAETRTKCKFGKPPENNAVPSQNKKPVPSQPPVENGQLNYYSFCKQFAPFASGRTNSNEGKSNINSTKSKLLENIQKEADKPEVPKRDKPKAPTLQNRNQQHDFSKQYSYHKPYDPGYAYQDYRQLEKKPQFNSPRGSFQAQESDFVKPEKPPRRFVEAATQNVAVQTTLESGTERRPSAPELVSSNVEHPVPQPRKRNSVSVQTTSPSLLSPVNYSTQTSTSPSITSPIPHAQQSFKPANYSGYHAPMPADQVPRNYYNNGSSYDSYAYPYKNGGQHEVLSPKPTPVETTPQLGISQKLYNEFSKLPADSNPAPPRDPFDYGKLDAPAYIPYKDSDEAKIPAFKPSVYPYEDSVNKPLPDVVEENIENQDISSDGIVTRYTCAIATISPDSPEPTIEKPPRSYEPVVPRIKEPQPQPHFAETTNVGCSLDEIQRHNILQQQLIRRMQNETMTERIPVPASRRFSQEIARKENRSPTSPSAPFSSANYPGRVCALKALNESHKAQEKIHMFEEKRNGSQQLFRPLNVPPKVNVVNPSSVLRQERSPIRNASPIDSSDEYLMSCASKPSRNLVLSKSESWHQLALARGAGGLAPVSQLKPPKPKSPSSLRLSKQFEASSASDNMRKMEEKIQRYFQGSGGAAAPVNYSHAEETTTTTKSKAKSKRNLQSKKSMNNLMRSHTMPHIFDDSVDVDQAFDSIFKEATRADNRH